MAEGEACVNAIPIVVGVILFALIFGPVGYEIWRYEGQRYPEFSVAVTGIAGLDPTLDLRRDGPLFPVFNLTFALKSFASQPVMSECSGGTDVLVSYGDALLGKAAAPFFCVEPRQEDERSTTAWGMNVDMPRFLRDRLAAELQRGEAVLDIKILEADPWTYYARCMVKIGGGLCPC